jgi:hypothetical protein
MKKVVFGVLAALFGIAGLVALLNVWYNVAGLLNVRDAASGETWGLIVASLAFFTLALGMFYGSYRLFRLATVMKIESRE